MYEEWVYEESESVSESVSLRACVYMCVCAWY